MVGDSLKTQQFQNSVILTYLIKAQVFPSRPKVHFSCSCSAVLVCVRSNLACETC